jgi:hypothetical protein
VGSGFAAQDKDDFTLGFSEKQIRYFLVAGVR